MDQGNWVFNAALPPTIQLGTPTPYIEHSTVIQQYPVVIVK